MESSAGAARKLGIRPGTQVTIMGMEPGAAAALLGDIPNDATLNGGGRRGDIVVLFADDLAAVHRDVQTAHQQVAPRGRLWVAYRKGQSRGANGEEVLHRDTLQRALAEHRLVGVSLIALDDVWSAMRVRALQA
ncbi:MAG TPA: hypothetical protein VFB58_02805 [Chloroflexota bacterium]|nr:hypothetical protein [Chloroflexota bacterium]